jgi:hypothetical protein
MHDDSISPLRQRMLDAMAVRNFSDKTRHDYVRHVRGFSGSQNAAAGAFSNCGRGVTLLLASMSQEGCTVCLRATC